MKKPNMWWKVKDGSHLARASLSCHQVKAMARTLWTSSFSIMTKRVVQRRESQDEPKTAVVKQERKRGTSDDQDWIGTHKIKTISTSQAMLNVFSPGLKTLTTWARSRPFWWWTRSCCAACIIGLPVSTEPVHSSLSLSCPSSWESVCLCPTWEDPGPLHPKSEAVPTTYVR